MIFKKEYIKFFSYSIIFTVKDNEKIYSRDPNMYSIQKALYDGKINSFKNVLRNLRNE